MAFYLGKVSNTVKRDLTLLRKIRNDFAHDATAIDFNNEKVRNRCRELYCPNQETKSRTQFINACILLLRYCHDLTKASVRPLIQEDNYIERVEERLRQNLSEEKEKRTSQNK